VDGTVAVSDEHERIGGLHKRLVADLGLKCERRVEVVADPGDR
jgi:hypothetical protein